MRRRLDAKFHGDGRKVALIIDNCPDHHNFDNLTAIKLVVLPPNTNSNTQLMDHGVIRVVKAFYPTNVVRRQIRHIDVDRTPPNINILEAMRMLVTSWDFVSAKTVKNCFTKAGIPKKTDWK